MKYDPETADIEWLFEQFAETNPDILFMFSADWNDLLFVNDAYEDIWGEPVDRLEAEPTSFVERVHPDDREDVREKMGKLANGEAIENEFRVLPAGDGGPEVRHLWSESRPVFDDDELVALSGFVRDVTEREKYRQELERSNERLEGFAQFLSHDIRNQLSVAKGHLDLGRTESEDDEHLETVERALERMRELTEDVLTLADLDPESLEKEEVVVAELAETCWESEGIDSDSGDLVIESNTTIHVSQRQFKGVFENLFRNAIEHTDKSPEVRVGSLSDEDGLYVEDNGQGIDPKNAEAIFEFGHTSGGTGLGLTLVREVVRLHEGEISVVDSEKGGARFEIELPNRRMTSVSSKASSESRS
jgi:PAS domain S-box-containing protein